MSPTGALADRFFAAITACDARALERLYAPDVEVWHNYDDAVQDRDESLATLAWLSRRVGPLRYRDIRRVEIDGGFVQQHVVVCEGLDLDMPAMLRVWCADDVITRIDEYVDPGPLNARLRACGEPDRISSRH